MFYGEYRHNFDEKGRIILPAKFREVCKENGIERFFLTRGLDKCIFMFSEDEWRQQEQKFKNMPFTRQKSRSFNRMFFSMAVDIVTDKQGRFIIPQYLKKYSNVDKEIVFIGVSNRIEIWDVKSWDNFYADSDSSFEETAENILDF